jgi:hypothetical protein
MGAEKVSASWMNLMKKLNPFEIGDNAVERNLTKRGAVRAGIGKLSVKLGNRNRSTNPRKERDYRFSWGCQSKPRIC